MMQEEKIENTIWTIGHSTHPLNEFISMLQSFNIRKVADIRNYPGSRRYPHFNKDALQISLPEHHIRYVHYRELGGRRKPEAGSFNTAWKHPAFRGYADYMETPSFRDAIEALEITARKERTAYMCSEAVWWRCHRSLISDYLKSRGWVVMHILDVDKTKEHPYTSPARIIDGKLSYHEESLFRE
jgi:uncharacterized protein (DUF488 family)